MPENILIHNLRGEGRKRYLHQRLDVLFRKFDGGGDVRQVIHSHLACLLETIRDLHGVNTFVQQLLSLHLTTCQECYLFQHGSSKHDNTGGSISHFIIL